MDSLTLATWNVNSLKVRLPQVLEYLDTYNIDVLCLQELKMQDADLPVAAFEDNGYSVFAHGQKTYNGVATIVKNVRGLEFTDVLKNNPLYPDPQSRLITGTIETPKGAVRLVNGYFPNGEEISSDKYVYKREWLRALNRFIADNLQAHESLILVGDFNIAPEDRDVYDPASWASSVLCVQPVRDEFQSLLKLGLTDAFRAKNDGEKLYSWWDYRMMAFRRNMGLRIDHILTTPDIAQKAAEVTIDKDMRKKERPSDHAPVRIRFTL
jgi:exodeoxyribonuclease-3